MVVYSIFKVIRNDSFIGIKFRKSLTEIGCNFAMYMHTCHANEKDINGVKIVQCDCQSNIAHLFQNMNDQLIDSRNTNTNILGVKFQCVIKAL